MSPSAPETATSTSVPAPLELPWLPPAETVVIPGRGEFFFRHHRHLDPTAPTLLLLHGWTASADLQYFTAYEALAERYSFIAIDHRGHGRGLRTTDRFRLEDAADDAAAVVRALGIGPVIALGYSMGGPIAMLLTRRHRHLVGGLVAQATALEWSAKVTDRLSWMWLPVLGAVLRSWAYPRYIRRAIERLIPPGHPIAPHLEWITAELRRNDPAAVVEAGRALKVYDARSWARSLDVPATVLVTTRDRLVRPRKQHALAAALGAEVVELRGDHLCTLALPAEYSTTLIRIVDGLVGRIGVGPGQPTGEISTSVSR